jgi:hypothetical protein
MSRFQLIAVLLGSFAFTLAVSVVNTMICWYTPAGFVQTILTVSLSFTFAVFVAVSLYSAKK